MDDNTTPETEDPTLDFPFDEEHAEPEEPTEPEEWPAPVPFDATLQVTLTFTEEHGKKTYASTFHLDARPWSEFPRSVAEVVERTISTHQGVLPILEEVKP